MTGADAPPISRGMWSYYPDLLAVPVPRYTSFPTAAEFADQVGAADTDAALRRVAGDVSLYVHIPFCEQICWYCGCNTGAANRRQRLASYLDALHREIALAGVRLDGRIAARRLTTWAGQPRRRPSTLAQSLWTVVLPRWFLATISSTEPVCRTCLQRHANVHPMARQPFLGIMLKMPRPMASSNWMVMGGP